MVNHLTSIIAITGASGLLGRALMMRMSQIPEYNCIGLGFNRAKPPLVKLDLTNEASLVWFLKEYRPNLIIHSAAERRPDVSERDREATDLINVHASRLLFEYAKALNIPVIFISTSYVFDGSSPPYKPDSTPNPLNYYGKTKVEGERLFSSIGVDGCILRLPALYGPVEFLEESSITELAKAAWTGHPLEHDHWAIRYPTHVDEVTQVCSALSSRLLSGGDIEGIYHWSGSEPFTRYQIVTLLADVLGKDPHVFKPLLEPSDTAPRPKDTCLDCSRLEGMFKIKRNQFASFIMECVEGHLMLGSGKRAV